MGVIKPQRYFSPSREYAQRYGLWTREYFLNIQNPFDVRNKKDAAILREFLPEGYKFSVGSTGALDWAELSSFDLDELIEAHPEYDGMIFDEGGEPNREVGVSYRGISFMPFKGGAQVKSATSNSGEYSPTNPDVRFSVRQYRFAFPDDRDFRCRCILSPSRNLLWKRRDLWRNPHLVFLCHPLYHYGFKRSDEDILSCDGGYDRGVMLVCGI